jgi:ATP-binding protein involved in chromosome partitioning
MNEIKHIIAVASGKGGVGKSTIAVNLALALQARGAQVGLLDADIYGPSQQVMLGVADSVSPEQQGAEFFLPVKVLGLKTMSMGYLVTERTPLVWRGPMAGSALAQMLEQTLWGELDYLIIDMPPGTGDVQLTLSQKASVAGAVIVTTPQDIALLDAQKGIEMFRKVDVPILGVVENMAMHTCSQCGHQEHIFGEAGGQQMAGEYGVPLLASLPLSRSVREHGDAGKPMVAAEPDSQVTAIYLQMADQIAAALAGRGDDMVHQFPEIKISDD